jgi:hypothetical protein
MNSALVGGEWSGSRHGRFTLCERDPPLDILGGPRACLDYVEQRKFLTLPGPVVQPVASRYTDYAIPIPCNVK